jgi:hypothetical protein
MEQVEVYTGAEGGAHAVRDLQLARAVEVVVVAGTAIGAAWHGVRLAGGTGGLWPDPAPKMAGAGPFVQR